MLASLAWRNIWRQPVRTGLSLLSMALAAMLMVFIMSLQLGVYDTMKTGALRLFDGFGQFQMPDYLEDPDIEHTLINADAIAQAALQVDGVTAQSPRAGSFAILANGDISFAAAVIGVDPALEPGVTSLGSSIEQGRFLQPGDDAAIVMGIGLARNLDLELGDGVTMLGTGNNGSVAADVLTLVGIFDTGIPMLDRQFTQMPLSRFDETFGMQGNINTIVVSGENLSAILSAEPQLRAIAAQNGVAFRNWEELQPTVKQMIDLDISTSMLTYITMIVLVVFIILNTLYMSVLERTREFGGLMAMGMRPGLIGRMVWLELLFLALLGNGIGILLGSTLVTIFANVGVSFPAMAEVFAQWGVPAVVYPMLSPLSMFLAPGVIVTAIAVLGFIPFRRILRLEPVSAMAEAGT